MMFSCIPLLVGGMLSLAAISHGKQRERIHSSDGVSLVLHETQPL